MRMHFPSLALGATVAAAVFLLLGAQRPPTTMGRYELEANQNHVFVLDRDTGRVWEKFVADDSGHTDQDFSQPKVNR